MIADKDRLQERPETEVRFKILQTILTRKPDGSPCRIYPEEFGCSFSDMTYQLRYMKNRNLLTYSPRIFMRSFMISILPQGKAVIDDFQSAFFSQDTDRDEKMQEALSRLK